MSRRYLLISTLPHLKMIFGEENFDYRCSNATILAILKMIFFPEASLNFMHSKIFSFECCQFFGKKDYCHSLQESKNKEFREDDFIFDFY